MPGRHVAPMDPGAVDPSAISPEHAATMSTASTQGKAGIAGGAVARPVRAPPVQPHSAPTPEEEDLAELFLPQPDPWEALDADIRKRHANLLDDLKRLCRQHKAALEARIRDAVERGDQGLAQLLRAMHSDMDEQFRLLAEHVTRLALEQLEEVWRRPGGPKSGRIAQELATLRQELEAQRAALRRHIVDSMRRAGESNCTGLLALLSQWQADAEDSLHQQMQEPLTAHKKRLKAHQERLAAARARARLLLHSQMRVAHETQETGLWNLLQELEQRAEEQFLELAHRIK
jgi:hypothetical protein